MRIGYARVSTQNQSLEAQIKALQDAGCKKIFSESISAVKKRPALNEMLEVLRSGDELVITKLDRLGRSIRHLVDLAERFKQDNIQLVSLNDSIDTSTASGRMMFHLLATVAEFERELTLERVKVGLQAAKHSGRVGGRPPALNEAQQAQALAMYAKRDKSAAAIARHFEISKPTLYKYINDSVDKRNQKQTQLTH